MQERSFYLGLNYIPLRMSLNTREWLLVFMFSILALEATGTYYPYGGGIVVCFLFHNLFFSYSFYFNFVTILIHLRVKQIIDKTDFPLKRLTPSKMQISIEIRFSKN